MKISLTYERWIGDRRLSVTVDLEKGETLDRTLPEVIKVVDEKVRAIDDRASKNS